MRRFALMALFCLSAVSIGCEEWDSLIGEEELPQLKIVVVNQSGIRQSDCQVSLYRNFEDWSSNQGSVGEKVTDGDGEVLFEDLSQATYFFFAEKGDLNNSTQVITFPETLDKNQITVIETTIE